MSKLVWPLLLSALAAGPAHATVTEVTGNGFSVHEVATTAANARKVYLTLIHDVGKWWNPAHTYSGNSRNLSISRSIGGCFCENLGHGGAVEHARIILMIPDSELRMTGAFGPLQSSALVGTMSFMLTVSGSGTKVELTYNVGGYMHAPFEDIAPVVDEVLDDQLKRLARFAETGRAQ